MTPSQVNTKNQEEVWQRLYGHDGKGVPKFRVSNRVRISKFKRLFEKGYMADWSEEMFTIHKVHPSDPPVYRLIDDLGEVLDGTFYEPELQKVSVPIDKVYRVESVLQRRKVGRRTEVLVKWYGSSSVRRILKVPRLFGISSRALVNSACFKGPLSIRHNLKVPLQFDAL